MPQSWGPTAPGRLFTRSADWKLALAGGQFLLQSGSTKIDGSILNLEKLRVEPGNFWATVRLPQPSGLDLSLDGIPNSSAKEMATAVAKAVKRIRIAELIQGLSQATRPVSQWAEKAREACSTQLATKGWLTQEFKKAFNSFKPHGLAELLAEPEVARHLETQPQALRGCGKPLEARLQ